MGFFKMTKLKKFSWSMASLFYILLQKITDTQIRVIHFIIMLIQIFLKRPFYHTQKIQVGFKFQIHIFLKKASSTPFHKSPQRTQKSKILWKKLFKTVRFVIIIRGGKCPLTIINMLKFQKSNGIRNENVPPQYLKISVIN